MAPSSRQPFSGQGVRRISGSNVGGSVTLRVGTVNVGTMKGRSAEVADMLKTRKVDVCGFQEVRFKGEGTRVIKDEDNGARFKWSWKGNGSSTNGVGFAIREDWAKSVVAVKRVSDRVLRVDIVIEAEVVSFVVVYAPQVGRSAEEKEKFYDSVYAVRADIRGRCVMLGDWNGHVGSVRKRYYAHGGFGVGDMNAEGEAILELAASCEMVVVNTWFIKEESKLVTYESSDSRTVVDYILVNKEERKNVKDAKVIAGEECVTQHKLLVMDWRIRKVKRRKVEGKGRLKLWKLRSNEGKQCFRDEIATLNVEGETVEERWTCLEKGVLTAVEKVCCRSKGGVVKEQAWWWDQRVSEVIGAKKLAFKRWRKLRTEADRIDYIRFKKKARKEVAKAIEMHQKELLVKMQENGRKALFRTARRSKKERNDILGAPGVQNHDGELKVLLEDRLEVCRAYCDRLMNVENEWNGEVEADEVLGPWETVTVDEVAAALRKMKKGKAMGPSEVGSEMLDNELCVRELCNVANEVLRGSKMPSTWRKSLAVPLYKGKGAATVCGNYRTIKLMEHALKIVERVFERRLREVVRMGEEQYGFIPGRGTTDACFVLRQLQEKFLEKDRELYMVFVDLEKAFDRVPRKVIEYAA
ncbi:uncharacterized protein LOC124445097 [Xenia sp. Carnegie-2017]|uniref:uncharacterized protein LOC124445097 n=1 Tax=Xenia sp. Carnegie-2017 TaxID=2897299 RepID=UPI001F045381|nr:uncharacterized protein LOC124445097 [Xenia sp. Carnegie-2017]